MNWLDIVIIVPLLWGIYRGFKRGLVTELSTLTALFAGVYISIYFSSYVGAFIKENFENLDADVIQIIAFVITFIGVVFGVHILGKVINKAVKLIALGLPNRIFGSLFSLIKYLLIVLVGLFLIENINKAIQIIPQTVINNSLLYNPILNTGKSVMPFLEEEKSAIERIEEKIESIPIKL